MSSLEKPQSSAGNMPENPSKDYNRIFIGILQGSGLQSVNPLIQHSRPFTNPNLENVRTMVGQLGVIEIAVSDPRFWRTFDALSSFEQGYVRRGIQTITGINLEKSRPVQE